jgi:hypothetical protein
LIGATRETTSSALNRLQRAGCIEIRRRRVIIRSAQSLEEHAGPDSAPNGIIAGEARNPALVRVQRVGA